MNDNFYYQLESIKKKLEYINREAWKYESLYNHQNLFKKYFFTTFLSRKKMKGDQQHPENRFDSSDGKGGESQL